MGTNGTNGTNGKSEVVNFHSDVPVQLAVKYKEPKLLDTQYGKRAMFTLCDGRIMFLDLDVAASIRMMDLQPGELFSICLRWNGKREQPKRWDVDRVSDAAEPAQPKPPETPLEKQLRESLILAQAAKNGNGANGVHPPAPQTAPIQSPTSQTQYTLLEQSTALIDVFAGALKYAQRYGDLDIAAEDIRSIVLSCYINVSKNGGCVR